MLSTLGDIKRLNWWSLQELTACSKCSIQQLSNCEWILGRDMISYPIHGPSSSAKGSEEHSCLWMELMSFPRREAVNLFLENKRAGSPLQ